MMGETCFHDETSERLKQAVQDYLSAKASIPKGLEMQEVFSARKSFIMQQLGATESQWNDWKWQMANRITDGNGLSAFINLAESEIEVINRLSQMYRMAISPYYLSLTDPNDPTCPIRRISIPQMLEETDDTGELDPMAEAAMNPAPLVTRRYPDRLIINVTNMCASYCRFCQRKRAFCNPEHVEVREQISKAIDYIRANTEIRDVLVTGGDALSLSDETLEWIFKELRSIPHVECIRLGTRMLVTLPQRITPELCGIIRKYHPIYINTHCNHPKEITGEMQNAANMLLEAGVPIGNQSVLLNGVNNDKYVMMCLNQELVKCRIRPYYLFHAKQIKGTRHFSCTIEEGLSIMEYLRGRTSGLTIPTYVLNTPGGMGKVPLLPEYVVGRESSKYIIRTWEGRILEYDDSV